LGSEGHFIVVGTYTDSPITAEPCRAKATSLRVRRSCFAPISWAASDGPSGGGAGYRPPVRSVYCTRVYRHSRLPGRANIGTERKDLKQLGTVENGRFCARCGTR